MMKDNPTIDLYADTWLSTQPTYLTDMDQYQPASAVSNEARHRRWRVMPYRGDHLSGQLLVAGAETEAPTITIPLNARGWHAVSIGAWRLKDWYLGSDGSPQLLARLSGQDAFSSLRLPTRPEPKDQVGDWHMWTGEEELSECFWMIADLSGRELEVGQPSWTETDRDGAEVIRCSLSTIAYIKLRPLTDAEVSVWENSQEVTHVPLYAHNDIMLTRASTPEELRRHIDPFGDSDFTRIYWEGAMGDLSSYFRTRNRTPEAIGRDDFFHTHARNEAACWRRWRASGHDPLEVAIDATHALGLDFHVCHRLGGFRLPPAHDYWDHGDTLYKRHPEWRGRNRDGSESPRLSFAYPEVRQHIIETYREMTEYGVDGVCLLYNRRHPLLEYEQPLIDGFRQQHGSDPHELEPDDPSWLRYRAGVLTQFMRELKDALNLPITAIVMSSAQENLINAMDPEGWIAAGVVDTLVPYTNHPEWNHSALSWQEGGALQPHARMTRATSCELAPCFHTPAMTAETYRETASRLAKDGADAFFFWWGDTGSLANYGAQWSAARRLGHLDEIESWQNAGGGSLDAPVYPIQALDGWDSHYVTPA